ncbi:MAG: DUF4870 domain-containing protein [Oscillospiraceae bacterium]|nr:DUF4870 domain-containing protein [Oscillospiraceae bacterium]MBR3952845.1 DUF4870 domain-containing protein [Oscillospiraceae bacterium]
MESNKLMAAISYIWILFLVPLFAAKDDAFARYHANQGLLLFLVSIILGIIGIIPLIGTAIAAVGGIVTFVFMILGIINALKGEMKPLPLIGGIQIIK